MPFGIVACTFSDNLSRNSCKHFGEGETIGACARAVVSLVSGKWVNVFLM